MVPLIYCLIGSLKEREKLVAGIITEAKRAIAIGHIQKYVEKKVR